MKTYLLILGCLFAFPVFLHAQLGIKGGLNFAKVTKASNINADNSTGFHVGVFLAPQSRGVIGFRSELIYS